MNSCNGVHLSNYLTLNMHALWISWYVVWWFKEFSTVGSTQTQDGKKAVCCMMGYRAAVTGWRFGSMARDLAPYLVLLGDVLLVVLLHLPELCLQTTELDLHLLHILQVPLGSLVQHLDGLGHVLDLRCHMDDIGLSN